MNYYRQRAYINLLAVTAIWSFASIVIKYTLEGFSPLTFLFYRFALSSIIALFTYNEIKKILKLPKQKLFMIIVYSFLSSTVALGFLFLGLDKTTVLNLSLITLAAPLLAAAAGVFFLKEKVTKQEKIGTSIAFSGTLLTVIEPILESAANIGSLEGNILIAIYLVCDIAALVLLKKLLRANETPAALTNFSFIVGFLSLTPLVLFKGGDVFVEIVNAPKIYHLGVFYMAFISGSLAYYLRAKAQKSIEIGEAALFSYLTSVVTIPQAVLILNEKITPLYLFGAAIILIGVVIAEYRSSSSRE
jgi:drug/metabolite transporter (DMT)-like permease